MLRQMLNKYCHKYATSHCVAWTNPSLVRFCSNQSHYSEHGRQLGGFEYKDEEEPFKSKWRIPFKDRAGFWKSKLDLFASRKFAAGITRLNLDNWKYLSVKEWLYKHQKQKMIYTQQFIEDRVNILGCDLAAAHFVVFRGGAVKFLNNNKWISDDKKKTEYDEDLPNVYDPKYILEAIDFTGSSVIYEGMVNIENLKSLKWLSFCRCSFFDNWGLDKISGDYGESLEYLDISHTNVTHHGLNALYRFRSLKTLKVDGLSEDPEFLLTCLEIKKHLPELIVEGISQETLIDDFKEEYLVSKVQV